MEIMKRGSVERSIVSLGHAVLQQARSSPADPAVALPPLSRDLKDSPVLKPAYPFGEAALNAEAAFFPESHPPAVHLPESFRGGCSFGSGSWPVSPAGFVCVAVS